MRKNAHAKWENDFERHAYKLCSHKRSNLNAFIIENINRQPFPDKKPGLNAQIN